MKKTVLIIASIFLLSLISAQGYYSDNGMNSNNNQVNASKDNSEDNTNDNTNNSQESQKQESDNYYSIIKEQNRLRIHENDSECPTNCTCTGSVIKCFFDGKREMTITAGKSGNIIIQIKGINMTTNVTLYKTENGTLYVVTKNNETKELKYLPEHALERVRENTQSRIENESIELDDNGTYHVSAEKKVKIFGLFNANERIQWQIDAQTGEIIKTNTPWWSAFASDQEPIVGNNCGTVSPDSRNDCCVGKGFNKWNDMTSQCEM